MAEQLCQNPNFWFAILLTSGLTFGTRLIERTLKFRLYPDDDMMYDMSYITSYSFFCLRIIFIPTSSTNTNTLLQLID